MDKSERKRFIFLFPVWGKSYVDMLMRYAVSALLADGNLPSLSKKADCSIVFLTSTETIEYISDHETTEVLEQFAKIDCLPIDLLIHLGNYGLTLTTAYGLGMREYGQKFPDAYFIMLNADFLVSNNSLLYLYDIVDQGYQAVLCPSVRCVGPEVESELEAAADNKTKSRSLSGREMVRLALSHPHWSFAAAFLNDYKFATNNVNKFFWRANQSTVLGCYYIQVPLCIRANEPLEKVVGFCDYSFVPELVRADNYYCIQDSDDIFMLELTEENAEIDQRVNEKLSDQEYANLLSDWTTNHHRQYAKRSYVIHSDELPNDLRAEEDKFRQRLGKITEHLSEKPQPHLDHHYWQPYWPAMDIDQLTAYEPLIGGKAGEDLKAQLQYKLEQKTKYSGFVNFLDMLIRPFTCEPNLELAIKQVSHDCDLVFTDFSFVPDKIYGETETEVIHLNSPNQRLALFTERIHEAKKVLIIASYQTLNKMYRRLPESSFRDKNFSILVYDTPIEQEDAKAFYERTLAKISYEPGSSVSANVHLVTSEYIHIMRHIGYILHYLPRTRSGLVARTYYSLLVLLIFPAIKLFRLIQKRLISSAENGAKLYEISGPNLLLVCQSLEDP